MEIVGGIDFLMLWVIINAVKYIKKKPTHPVIYTILLALGSWADTRQRKTKRQITGPCLAKVDMVLNISHLSFFYIGDLDYLTVSNLLSR